ncbi:ThiF family adenylyltransferase [Alkalicoccus chagannorensis]|uniref:ThiF family adenylyltransferase n=1 Tax=Alkalicoccus chagannorensis TaxID=427072 RepID=UPI0004283ADB|nr:ThiF family adenylyltransferase [Alkalicoccus chagannorensis]
MNERYSRQTRFPGIGPDGQARIASAEILIAGAGALGSAAAEMLVRAGVGTVTIVDRDYVEFSNLQRQQLYTEADAEARMPKAAAAEKRLKEINSSVEITGIIGEITPELLESYDHVDVIIDGLDNFETRMVINDAAQKAGIPFVYGACVSSYGLSYTVLPGKKPCLQCILGTVPGGGETCDTAGIIGPAVQLTASYQTAEVLKLLAGAEDQLRNGLIQYDVWANETRTMGVDRLKRHDCPSCGENPVYPNLERGARTQTAVLCGRDTVQIRPAKHVAFEELRRTLASYELQENPYLMQVKLEGHRVVLFHDGRALVHNTQEPSAALSLYQRYIGS